MSNNINLTAGMRSNLSSLQNLNKALQTTQTRLSTGKKVNSALGDPATFYQASALNQRVSALDRLLDAMGQSMQTISIANAGIEAGLKTLEQMKQTAQQAAGLEILPETRSVETNTAATEAGMTIALRSAPVAESSEVGEAAPTTQMVFEVGAAHDGKGNTAALLEQFEDGAMAASWCNQFYAPGVRKYDENFGAGQWYLPAVGELIDAFGEVEPVYYANFYKYEIVTQKFDLESEQWVDCSQDEYDQLREEGYYYKRVGSTSGSTYSQISKQDFEELISTNGGNSVRIDGQLIVVRAGTTQRTKPVAISEEEFLQSVDNYYLLCARDRVTDEEIYTEITKQEYEDREHLNDDNFTYYAYCGVNVNIWSSRDDELEISPDEYESGIYCTVSGENNYTRITAEEYLKLAMYGDCYPYLDAGMKSIDGDVVDFGRAGAIFYKLNLSNNYDTIINTLQTIETVDGFGNISDTFDTGFWTSSVGDYGIWCLSSGEDDGMIYKANVMNYQDMKYLRPFTLLENKFSAEDNLQIGEIMYSDLSRSSAEEYQENIANGKTAVGVVTWVSKDGASARLMGLHNISANWDDRANDYVFNPNNPYNDSQVFFSDSNKWRHDIEDIADILDWRDAYLYSSGAEWSAMFDGRANTQALLDAYGEDAIAASACKAFYAGAADNQYFGKGTWYLPAVGEIMDADAKWMVYDYNQPLFVCYSPHIEYMELVTDGDGWYSWEETTAQNYETLLSNSFYLITNDYQTGESSVQPISKEAYENFIAENNGYQIGDENSVSYVTAGCNMIIDRWGEEIELDTYESIKDDYYYMKTYCDGYEVNNKITKEEFEAFVNKYGSMSYSNEYGTSISVDNACFCVRGEYERSEKEEYERIKDDYYFIRQWVPCVNDEGVTTRISKQEYDALLLQHPDKYWGGEYDEDCYELIGCYCYLDTYDDASRAAINRTLGILSDNGVDAAQLSTTYNDWGGYSSWSNYCTSTEVANGQMYTIDYSYPVVSEAGYPLHTRAFNLIENKFGNNETKPVVGDVMYDDLSYGAADDYNEYKTAVGVVAWVSDDGASAKIISLKDLYTDDEEPQNLCNLNTYYLNNSDLFNINVWQISTDDLMDVYTQSNPGSMVERTIEPEPTEDPITPKEVEQYNQQFSTINDQFKAILSDSVYNGTALLRGQNLKVQLGEKNEHIIEMKGLELEEVNMDQWETQEDIEASIAQIDRNIAALQAYAQELSNAEQIMQIRQNFNDAMRDILQVGSDNLTLADMNEETANYLAMQTRQQLAINALALAAQSDQSILKLFN